MLLLSSWLQENYQTPGGGNNRSKGVFSEAAQPPAERHACHVESVSADGWTEGDVKRGTSARSRSAAGARGCFNDIFEVRTRHVFIVIEPKHPFCPAPAAPVTITHRPARAFQGQARGPPVRIFPKQHVSARTRNHRLHQLDGPERRRARLTQLVGLMAAVHSAVGVNLEVEADAHPAVEPARPASRADPPLLHKLAFQRDALRSRGGVDQVSDGQKVERKVHSSQKGDAG